ncbi:uncharacterized protein LACBIDRAFT_335960 [Laccaria bicolor S238N-H82]|uniref:Predicted protein n=1 Tax=Laccaria bicolor (strain S238N-H82 / ATCC MYA-4686) TaxID=486041 RepID=B0E3Y9_LACBS|nr:uncharacterized protein LACBIDRAFT_335960 [Laccaria bicolor S238N-H82]EDQ98442.1 predicted protein [Laccaria bicolor S238N-H82]|eukprot:XP_001890906.1 predicted protein [Laccaria bicolor S238N-H82]
MKALLALWLLLAVPALGDLDISVVHCKYHLSRCRHSPTMRLSKSHAQQPATKGFGQVFHSPKKRRDSHKTSTQVTYLGQADKPRRAQEVLARLLADPGEEEDDEGGDDCEGSMEVPGDLGNSGSGFAWGEGDGDGDGDDFSMPDNGMDVDLCPSTPQKSDPIPPKMPIPAKVRHTGPDAEANLLYQQWQALIPRLVSLFLSFISATHGKKTFPIDGGEIVQDTFCRGLGHAIQWYDSLQVQIEQELKAATVAGDAATPCSSETNPATITTPEAPIPKQLTPDYSLAEPPLSLVELTPDDSPPEPPVPLSSARGFYSNTVQLALDCGHLGVQEQYYADQDVPRGTDFIIAPDGNFSQCHRKDVGDCPEFYRPEYFLTKVYVDNVGKCITEAQGQLPQACKAAKVPDKAVDECEDGHDSGSGSTIKTNMDHYDDGGVMALVCCHDAPLFLANIDTPGEQAMVTILYDVACVLDRSLNLWSCQLIYNPHIREGPSLSDGEGVERFWSHLRKMIGVTSVSARRRHIWMLDCQSRSIGAELQDDLGDWIRRRLKTIATKENEARKMLSKCGVPCLKEKVEQLYASLNIQDSFPELKDIDLDFVKLLVLARDLKINIRKQAIGSFFEWDRLDQAAGGCQHAIGTKIHQNTRNAIAKCKPALLRSIRKFNNYCEQLAAMYRPDWELPLPDALPVKLNDLRNSPLLMEDIWITCTTLEVPHWLQEVEVWVGIQAMLKLDHCLEECRRLGVEADNLCCWFGRELLALETAVLSPSNQTIQTLLKSRCDHLISLKSRWSNTLASSPRFDTHVQAALKIRHQDPTNASVTSPSPDPLMMTWLQLLTQDVGELTFADPVYHTADLINLDDMPTDTGEILFGNMIDAEVDEDDEDEAPPPQDNEPLTEIPQLTETGAEYPTRNPTYTFLRWMTSYASKPQGLASMMFASTAQLPSFNTGGLTPATITKQTVNISPTWKWEIGEIMLLITCLVLASNHEGHPLHVITEEGWTTQPLLLNAVQKDAFSCGLWVLAAIAAVLRGCHITGLKEGEIETFRRALLNYSDEHTLHFIKVTTLDTHDI